MTMGLRVVGMDNGTKAMVQGVVESITMNKGRTARVLDPYFIVYATLRFRPSARKK